MTTQEDIDRWRRWVENPRNIDPRDYADLNDFINAVIDLSNNGIVEREKDWLVQQYGQFHIVDEDFVIQTKSQIAVIANQDRKRRDRIFMRKEKMREERWKTLKPMTPKERTAYLNAQLPKRLKVVPHLKAPEEKQKPMRAIVQPRGKAYAIRKKTGRKVRVRSVSITERRITFRGANEKRIASMRNGYKTVQSAAMAISKQTVRGNILNEKKIVSRMTRMFKALQAALQANKVIDKVLPQSSSSSS